MSGIVATPPAIVLNHRTARLHVETCPTVKARPDDCDPIFTNWGSKDIAIAVHGQNLRPCGGCKPLTRIATWEHHHRPAAELAVLVEAVEKHRFVLLDEKTLQEALAVLLSPARREVHLSLGGRVDLMIGRTAVEVKVAGSAADVFRQVQRYAHSPEVAGLLIVTTKAEHLQVTPRVVGKPLRVALVRGGL